MKTNLKKCFALLLSVIMVLAMSVTVFATAVSNNGASTDGGKTTVAVTDKTKTKGTLTVQAGTENATYTAYKLYSAILGNGDTYTWTAVDAWKDALAGNTPESIAAMNASALKTLAASLATNTNLNGKTGTTVSGATDLDLGYYLVVETGTSGLEKSQPMLVAIPQVQNNAWNYDISVTPKSSSTDFEKKIAENGKLVDTNTAKIGEYVEYRLIADVPTYDDDAYTNENTELKFNITDNMSKELTWGANSKVTVYVSNTNNATAENIALLSNLEEITENYKVTLPQTNAKGGTFLVEFDKTFLSSHKGEKVIVAFSAQLNEDAIIGDGTGDNTIAGYPEDGDDKVKDEYYNGKGNPNGAKLEYSNSFNGGSETKTIKDIVTTFTFDLKVEKVDATNNEIKLGGAEFTVYTDAECTQKYENDSDEFTNPLVTSNDETAKGKVTAVGFKDGTYYIKETKAPTGYQQYDGIIKVVIVAKKDAGNEYTGEFTYTVDLGKYDAESKAWVADKSGTEKSDQTIVTVEDEKGLTLPGTGGIGTTIFTFGGLALVVLAAAMFVVYMRKQKKQA